MNTASKKIKFSRTYVVLDSMKYYLFSVLLVFSGVSYGGGLTEGVFLPEQIWKGNYFCGNEPSQLTLNVTHVIDNGFYGIMEYVTSTGVSGKYKVESKLFSHDNIQAEPKGDIVMPRGYVGVGFNFKLTNNMQTLKGTVKHPTCTTSELSKFSVGKDLRKSGELIAKGISNDIKYNSKEFSLSEEMPDLDLKGLRLGQSLEQYVNVLKDLGVEDITLSDIDTYVRETIAMNTAEEFIKSLQYDERKALLAVIDLEQYLKTLKDLGLQDAALSYVGAYAQEAAIMNSPGEFSKSPQYGERKALLNDLWKKLKMRYGGIPEVHYSIPIKLKNHNQELVLSIDYVTGKLRNIYFNDYRLVDCDAADDAFEKKYGEEPSAQEYLDLLDAQYEYGAILSPRYADLARATLRYRQPAETLRLYGDRKDMGKYERIAIKGTTTARLVANCPSGSITIQVNDNPYSVMLDHSSKERIGDLRYQAKIAIEKMEEIERQKKTINDIGGL